MRSALFLPSGAGYRASPCDPLRLRLRLCLRARRREAHGHYTDIASAGAISYDMHTFYMWRAGVRAGGLARGQLRGSGVWHIAASTINVRNTKETRSVHCSTPTGQVQGQVPAPVPSSIPRRLLP